MNIIVGFLYAPVTPRRARVKNENRTWFVSIKNYMRAGPVTIRTSPSRTTHSRKRKTNAQPLES